MEEEQSFDFATNSSRIGVKDSVLRLLFDIYKYEDTREWICKANNETEFWERVDTLPPEISIQLHNEELKMEEGKDFPQGSIDPVFFEHFQANCILNDIPTLPANRTTLQLIPAQIVEDILKNDEWEKIDENTFSYKDFSFEIYPLQLMCNSYIYNTASWVNCPYEPLRANYLKICDFMEENVEASLKPGCANVYNKMQHFYYLNSDMFTEDIYLLLTNDKQPILKSIEPFSLDEEIISKFVSLMEQAEVYFKENKEPSYSQPKEIDDSTIMRTENLINQLHLPFPQRGAFALTPAMISARIGNNPPSSEDGKKQEPFEHGSLAELLFCDSTGNPMPMPYQNSAVDIPSQSLHNFCFTAIRKFVAMVLSDNQITAAPASVLDVLTDYTQGLIRTLAQYPKAKSKKYPTQAEALKQAMLEIGFIPKPSLQ